MVASFSMKSTRLLRSLALFSLCFALACSDDATEEPPPPEETPDTSAEDSAESDTKRSVTQGSYYTLTVVGPSGLQQKYERNIDEKPYVVAFGSSHIAPAVSLAIEDTFYDPFAVVTFNLGFVVGSNDHEVTIDDTGGWDWGLGANNAPPGFKITMKDGNVQREFVSWLEGADGRFIISRWGTNTGDVIEGSIQGTLINNGPDAVTATVDGKFQFFLPEKGQGQ